MSREILFRGKRTDNGEWVYGYYVKKNVIGGVNHLIYPANNDRLAYTKPYIVDPETVGQCSGLYDDYGVGIFDGDIIEFFGKMKYGNGDTSSADAYCNDHEKMIEFFRYSKVIGNIHDNPELLKEAVKQ